MAHSSEHDDPPIDDLFERAASDDHVALSELLGKHRERLKSMVRLRLNPRVQRRVDESDIVQDTLVDAAIKFRDYAAAPKLPFYLWLRHIAGLKLNEFHRRHLTTQKRDAKQEVSLCRNIPDASSVSIAAQLLGKLTSPSQAAMKAELRLRIQDALNAMDDVDREVLVLRHFEQLTTAETAQVLGLSKSGAGHRYLNALSRLREVLHDIPGGLDL